MSIIQEMLSKQPPRFIYHYTNQAGLKGILEEKQIWASDVHYLNDSQEFSHAVEIVKAEIRRRLKGKAAKTHGAFFLQVQKMLEFISPFAMYVSSFSGEIDKLSQWRGYCSNGQGFCICFDAGKLGEIMRTHKFILRPCIYEEKEQKLFLKELLDNFMVDYDNAISNGSNRVDEVVGNFIFRFIGYAPLMKIAAFSEEMEWRVIFEIPSMKDSKKLKWRAGKSALIPYLEVGLSNALHDLPITKIIVGPGPHQAHILN